MAELKPIHEGLVPLAEQRFTFSEAPYQLVTFLNQTLKGRGLIFGLRRAAPGLYSISVYDASDQARAAAPSAAPGTPADGSGGVEPGPEGDA